jgi:hypothetical protein
MAYIVPVPATALQPAEGPDGRHQGDVCHGKRRQTAFADPQVLDEPRKTAPRGRQDGAPRPSAQDTASGAAVRGAKVSKLHLRSEDTFLRDLLWTYLLHSQEYYLASKRLANYFLF